MPHPPPFGLTCPEPCTLGIQVPKCAPRCLHHGRDRSMPKEGLPYATLKFTPLLSLIAVYFNSLISISGTAAKQKVVLLFINDSDRIK